MTTEAINAHGTQFQRGNGAVPEVFTSVAELGDVKPPALSKTRHDATTHGSNGWTERISGNKTAGPMTFPINWVPGNATHDDQTGLIADLVSEQDRNYRLVFPDGTKLTFRGTVTKFTPGAPVDGKLTAEVEVDPSGVPTWS